jgi:hypothetical protein
MYAGDKCMRMSAFREVAEIVNQKNQRRLIVGETELKNILSCVKDDILTPGNKEMSAMMK